MLDGLAKNRLDAKKPRKEGLTCTIDKFQGLDREDFSIVAPFVDVVKVYGALPMLVSDESIRKKIEFYHGFGIKVSTGSTITEFAIVESSLERFAKEAARVGFDMVEIGESSIDLTMVQKKKITEAIKSTGLEYQWKVGKKDPRHQLGLDDTLRKIDEAVKLESRKIVVEANEGYNVGIYDEKGLVKWSFVGAMTNEYPPSTFIFEAPLESQQSALMAEFGQRVNLAEVHPEAIASVESQRRGFLAKSAFGVSYIRKDPEGGPASKFIYYIIKTKHPVEQGELMSLSHLPRRTVQAAVDDLKRQGLIIEHSSLDDARKKVYDPVHSEWL
ncbi:phosphosulfolactate synthase [Candidatus Nitrososphaera sp. FF02]|uniref:phosphosulfolactate synthase n=1 Tax=Candidatus Nitrososphaera sp. FF02 TaxID=3398226 RepID=UPI0039E95648